MNRLAKSSNKVISGVLAGIGEYLGVSPTWLRIGFVLLAFIPGIFFTLLIVYIIAAIIMPEADEVVSRGADYRGSRRGLLWLGVIFVVAGIFFLLNQLLPIDLMHYLRYLMAVSKEYIIAIVLIFLGLMLIYRSGSRKETIIIEHVVDENDEEGGK